jgi:hypothetical protein
MAKINICFIQFKNPTPDYDHVNFEKELEISNKWILSYPLQRLATVDMHGFSLLLEVDPGKATLELFHHFGNLYM